LGLCFTILAIDIASPIAAIKIIGIYRTRPSFAQPEHLPDRGRSTGPMVTRAGEKSLSHFLSDRPPPGKLLGATTMSRRHGSSVMDHQTDRQTVMIHAECSADPTEVGLVVEEIYRRYGQRVYALAMRMTGNEADAEDITQEVLLQVVRRLDTFRGESTLATWLHRVTVNAVLVLRRKRATARERQLGEMAGEIAPMPRPGSRGRSGPSPEAEALGGELRDRLATAIALLPDAYRDPFVLSDVERFSNAEICDLLGLSLPAVKSRLHRARLMLRDTLQPYMTERQPVC
jgi:RNA polymerase sigma-70 factor (ECF subfamily)